MFGQSFELSDFPQIIVLAFVELLLSADNAVVLGALIIRLPSHLRRRALTIGIVSAFFIRAAALASIGIIFKYVWIQLLGAAYLIHLSVSYFTKKLKPVDYHVSSSFWKTVVLIEVFDTIFAIDSIVAGVAFVNASHSKLWIVYLGGMIGLIGTRFAAVFFGSLIGRFPHLEASAYILVGWVGVKLSLATISVVIPPPVFWSFIVIALLFGFLKHKR